MTMNAQNAKLYLPLVQALADGKQLQVLACGKTWEDRTDLIFDAPPNAYRIKPEPRTLFAVYMPEGALFDACETEADAKQSRCVVNGTISKFQEVV